jgi:hypothetical protein
MKKIFLFLAATGAVAVAGTAVAQPDVNVSIGINQPGVYGRIHIGDAPRPSLVLADPVIVVQPSVRVERQPIYLYVPADHQRNWPRYCSRYAACGQPVYFVQERWVRERYEHQHPGWERGRRDRDHNADRGRGRGHDRARHENHGHPDHRDSRGHRPGGRHD